MSTTYTSGARLLAGVLLFAAFQSSLHAQHPQPDPTQAEVPLPAGEGWRATLVLDNQGVGVWTVKALPVFAQLGSPEIAGLDDLGRCQVLVGYSGKWTPTPIVHDGKWLGGLAHGDIDPRAPGAEIYVGGQRGNLFQIRAYADGALDCRLIAQLPGEEIHTMIAGDLDPSIPGKELLAFTAPGALHLLRPAGEHGNFLIEKLQDLPSRVRDVVALPSEKGEAPWLATASRDGRLTLLRLVGGKPRWKSIFQGPMGQGRLALAPAPAGAATVLYSSHDDGCIMRHEARAEGTWQSEMIYAGPQGPRGLVAGRFSADPELETIAVFGYAKKVQLLSRRGQGAWQLETLFEAKDKGHWLAVGELDGRNGTDEIIGSGYSGRIFLLSRPPGYGIDVMVSDPDPRPAELSGFARVERPAVLRVAVKASEVAARELSPLNYQGGFETKSLIYETLVRRDATGCIVPGLASSWRFEDEGRAVRFELRKGARFHDGQPVTAEAVRQHFKRWVGLPEHAWIRASERIRMVEAISPSELLISMDRPYALLPDLCAINPCAIRGPGALDREGKFVAPVGSGPFRLLEVDADQRRMRIVRHGTGTESLQAAKPIDLIRFPKRPEHDPIDALLRGEVDVVVGGWQYQVPRARLAELEADPSLCVLEAHGSSVTYLSFPLEKGPTSRLALRQAIAAAIDREEIIREVEAGCADPCRSWAAPSVMVWPRSRVQGNSKERSGLQLLTPLRVQSSLLAGNGLARILVEQLRAAGLPAVEVLDTAGECDIRIERTWGVPYDPYLSLISRFMPAPSQPSADEARDRDRHPVLVELIETAMACPEEATRSVVYGEIQALMDREALIVPLYVPRRIAVFPVEYSHFAVDHNLYAVDLRAFSDLR